MDGQGGVGAALGEAEDRIAGDFVHEADAAAAEDAALVVEADAGADIDVFGLFHLVIGEAGAAAAVFDGVFLEAAFAGLVADRAIEGVVDEEELHDALAAGFDQLAAGADAHVFGDGIGAGDDRAWHPTDRFVAIGIALRLLARGGAGRHAHLDQAHAAVARRAELRVVAVVWHDDTGLAAGFDHAGSFGEAVPCAIDLDVDHAGLRRLILGQFGFQGRRRGVVHVGKWQTIVQRVPDVGSRGNMSFGHGRGKRALREKSEKNPGLVFLWVAVGFLGLAACEERGCCEVYDQKQKTPAVMRAGVFGMNVESSVA